MNSLILSFVLLLTFAVNVFAEGDWAIEQVRRIEFSWEKDVDSSTKWGKWLNTTVKPYLESKYYALADSFIKLPQEPSDNDFKELALASFKAFKSIEPPVELKNYHLMYLEIYEFPTKSNMVDMALQNKRDALLLEASKELERVLSANEVPKEIIEKIINPPYHNSVR